VKREGKLVADRTLLVDGLTEHIDNAAKKLGADWHRDGAASVGDTLATGETLGGIHSNGADGALTKVLSDLEHQAALGAVLVLLKVLDLETVENGRKLIVELDVDNGTNHLGDLATGGGSRGHVTYEAVSFHGQRNAWSLRMVPPPG